MDPDKIVKPYTLDFLGNYAVLECVVFNSWIVELVAWACLTNTGWGPSLTCKFARMRRLVLPPSVDDDPWNMEDPGHDDLEVNRRPYEPDPPQPPSLLSEDIGRVRDAAYMIGAARMRGSLQRMYNLHVSLTYELLHYAEEGAPDIQSHCDMVMSREALPTDRLTTCRLLQAAIQQSESSIQG